MVTDNYYEREDIDLVVINQGVSFDEMSKNIGEYELFLKATDKSNNVSELSKIILRVIEKEDPDPTEPGSTEPKPTDPKPTEPTELEPTKEPKTTVSTPTGDVKAVTLGYKGIKKPKRCCQQQQQGY